MASPPHNAPNAEATKSRNEGCRPGEKCEFDGFGQPYLSKPFPPEAFLQRVEQILSAG
jgi:hypothetical protein